MSLFSHEFVVGTILVDAKEFELRHNPTNWFFKYEVGRWVKYQDFDTNTGNDEGAPYWKFQVVDFSVRKDSPRLKTVLENFQKLDRLGKE